MKTIVTLCGVIFALCLAMPTWAASNELAGVPPALQSQLKADHKTVKSDRETLDAAEAAANLPLTFAEHQGGGHSGQHAGQTQQPPPQPPSPATHISNEIKHVEHEIQKVQTLLTQSNLPSAVTSAAQKLQTDLNTLLNDLNQALTDVGGSTK
jgi:hypothetical protein